MTVCLSFDDGREDQYSIAYPILVKYKLTATFFVTTGFIDGTFKSDCFGIGRKPISIEGVVDMYKNGMEIASHGDRHITDPEDFEKSIAKLKQWGVHYTKYGFSVPNSNYKIDCLNNFLNKYKHSLSYIRVGRHPNCYSFKNKFNYLFYNLFGFYSNYDNFNRNNLISHLNDRVLYSLVVKRNTSPKTLIRFLDKYKNDDCVLIIMFHTLSKKPKNKWEWNGNHFEMVCRHLFDNSKQFEVQTIRQLFN